MRKDLIWPFWRDVRFKQFGLLLVFLKVIFFSSCKKDYSLPPQTELSEGPTIMLADLQKLLKTNTVHRFSTGDTSLLLTVTMDESSGNIYKSIFAQDQQQQGIQVRLLNSGGLYEGDLFRLNLNGCYACCINNQFYIDSVDVSKNVIKRSSGNTINPQVTVVSQLANFNQALHENNLQNRLIRLEDVEFAMQAKGKTLANAVTKSSSEHPVLSCGGTSITLRTSGFAKFANSVIPFGHGDITGILTQYNNNYTLLLRTEKEMRLDAVSCLPPDTSQSHYLLYKDFEDQSLLSGGWESGVKKGITTFTVSNFAQANYYARITNKIGSDYEACDTWLISPPINLEQTQNPVLNFKTANSSATASLVLMAGLDYGQATENWTTLSFEFQKGSFSYYPSGDIDLSAYKGQTIRIAFKYATIAGTGAIWNLDDIQLKEKK